jgi:uncharacterized membrane-anchored protein
MIKALWFLIKVTALIAIVVWLADRPGTMRLDWIDLQGNDIAVNVQIGVFLAALFGFVLLSIFIYQTIKTFVDLPKSMARYNEIKAREKGYKALTLGLAAVAAGDRSGAVKQAKKARKFLPDDTGLPMLLDAQAARLDGRESDAAQSFVALLEDKDASFLGVRGLLQAALDTRDYDTALTLAERAMASYPKQVWILKIAYDLQLKAKTWDRARGTLRALEKSGGISAERAQSDKAAILVAAGDEQLEHGDAVYAFHAIARASGRWRHGMASPSRWLYCRRRNLRNDGKRQAQALSRIIFRRFKHNARHPRNVIKQNNILPMRIRVSPFKRIKRTIRRKTRLPRGKNAPRLTAHPCLRRRRINRHRKPRTNSLFIAPRTLFQLSQRLI